MTTNARGTASFTPNAGKDMLFIAGSFTGLSSPITMAHVHNGFEGVAGPVVTNLFSMIKGNQLNGFLTGDDIAPAKIDRYLRGAYYINIHTAANSGGEIRRQVLRGARSLSVLLAAQPSALVAEGFAAAPNPFRDELSLSFEARSGGTGTLRVTDLLGRTVTTQTVNVRPVTNRTEVKVPGAAGVYVLVLELNNSRIVSRITKQ